MKKIVTLTIITLFVSLPILSEPAPLPDPIKKIMDQPQYTTAHWGIYVRDLTTDDVKYRLNSNNMFIPASVSKLFSVQALIHTYGYDYTFRTPIYALGKIDANGTLNGDLVLVATGDLTLGGRHMENNKIAYTNYDHVDANAIPIATLTEPDPLNGIKQLAKQIRDSGIKTINGNILIDTRLFETLKMRENIISPIIINDNLIDVEVKPTHVNEKASLAWRPQLTSMKMVNEVLTVSVGKKSGIEIAINDAGDQITVTGTIATDKKNILNVATIEDPSRFAKSALIEALQQNGITVNTPKTPSTLPDPHAYAKLKPIATLTSEPLIEYAKLILKVSHNVGANLIPLLLASYHGKTSLEDGMKYLGKFFSNDVHINPNEISFGDGAGGNDNYASLDAIMKLLTYEYKSEPAVFEQDIYTLPILGVDGSLADTAGQTLAKGNVFAKSGTGVIYNALQGNLFLTTKSLAGYMHLKNNHWVAFVIIINNTALKDINTVFSINDDIGMITAKFYDILNQ
jgi:D-alanyl-D-alanine carboxypeptidase/D-alanyl-D-alanine-endopeptidase (penicillin-binding protein 4)